MDQGEWKMQIVLNNGVAVYQSVVCRVSSVYDMNEIRVGQWTTSGKVVMELPQVNIGVKYNQTTLVNIIVDQHEKETEMYDIKLNYCRADDSLADELNVSNWWEVIKCDQKMHKIAFSTDDPRFLIILTFSNSAGSGIIVHAARLVASYQDFERVLSLIKV